MSPEQVARAWELVAAGGTERGIARELGVSRRQLRKVLFPAPKPEPEPSANGTPLEREPPTELTYAGVPTGPAPVWSPPAAEPPPTVDRLAQAGREQAAAHLAAGQPLQAKRALDVAVLAEKASAAAQREKQTPVTEGPRLSHLTDREFDEFAALTTRLAELTTASHDPTREPAPSSAERPHPEAARWRFEERATAFEHATAAQLRGAIEQMRGAIEGLEVDLRTLYESVYGRPRRRPLLNASGEDAPPASP